MNGSDSENVKVILSIGGTEYEGIECLLPLNRPIRECVESFNLPRFDDGGNPLQYLLCKIRSIATHLFVNSAAQPNIERTMADKGFNPDITVMPDLIGHLSMIAERNKKGISLGLRCL